ncbi:WD40 repeat domain-containing protein [Saccharicrinis sp. FJH2]|uniref:WD40 repeat domain-containing protein n=1 Tax=Saccharicrinis sp. FJH65 TaxID=3344659 RepID=UPI0035F28E05
MKNPKLSLVLISIFLVLNSFKYSDEIVRVPEGHEWSITDVDINEKGNLLLSGSWDKTMKLWDVSVDSAIYTFSNHEEMIWDVAFIHDEKYVASCSWDGSINIWDLDSKKLLRVFWHSPKIEKIQYEPFYQKRTVPNMCN